MKVTEGPGWLRYATVYCSLATGRNTYKQRQADGHHYVCEKGACLIHVDII